MAPTKPSDTSCKPTVASAGTTLARGYYRRDDLLPHPNNANLKRDDDDTSSLSSSDTTHESTQPSPVVAAAKVDDAVDDADDGDMKPAAKDDDEVVVGGEVVQIKREMNEYDEDTVHQIMMTWKTIQSLCCCSSSSTTASNYSYTIIFHRFTSE